MYCELGNRVLNVCHMKFLSQMFNVGLHKAGDFLYRTAAESYQTPILASPLWTLSATAQAGRCLSGPWTDMASTICTLWEQFLHVADQQPQCFPASS